MGEYALLCFYEIIKMIGLLLMLVLLTAAAVLFCLSVVLITDGRRFASIRQRLVKNYVVRLYNIQAKEPPNAERLSRFRSYLAKGIFYFGLCFIFLGGAIFADVELDGSPHILFPCLIALWLFMMLCGLSVIKAGEIAGGGNDPA